jgi:Fe-S cluster biosynthesis and repair protein YggX
LFCDIIITEREGKKMKIQRYELYKLLYEQNYISKEAWQEFCTQCLEELMEENKEVLIRLKEK